MDAPVDNGAVVLERPLSPRECAELAGMHYDTIRKAIAHGHLRAYRPGGQRSLVVKPSDLEAWLYGQERAPTDPAGRMVPTDAGRRRQDGTGSVARLEAIERGEL